MKIAKWICRYAFFGLLLALCVLWCLQCQKTVNQLNAQINSVEYIDMVLENQDKALALENEVLQFQGYQKTGILIGCVVLGLLLLLIMWNIFGNRISGKIKALFRKKEKVEVPEAVPAVQVEEANIPQAAAAPVETDVETSAEEQPADMTEELPAENVQTADVAEEQPVLPAEAEETPAGVTCPNCGQYYPGAPAFCTNCGAKLS